MNDTQPLLVPILTPAIVPLALALAKVAFPRLPKVWLPILAPLLGALLEIVATFSVDQNTLLGAGLGALGVWLREVVDQIKKLHDQSLGLGPRVMLTSLIGAIGLLGLMTLQGCGWNRQKFTSPVIGTNGSVACDTKGNPVLRTLSSTEYAIIQARQSASIKASQGVWNHDRQSLGATVDQTTEGERLIGAMVEGMKVAAGSYAAYLGAPVGGGGAAPSAAPKVRDLGILLEAKPEPTEKPAGLPSNVVFLQKAVKNDDGTLTVCGMGGRCWAVPTGWRETKLANGGTLYTWADNNWVLTN
jgi:hypothetical protein